MSDSPPTLRKFGQPWMALFLTIVTYATVGWMISSKGHRMPNLPLSLPEQWLLYGFVVTILGTIATYPTKSIQLGFTNLFSPNFRALVLLFAVSIVAVILFTWTAIFIDVVVLLSAGLLLSLDMKLARWNKIQRLISIVLCQLFGFYLGIAAHQVSIHPEYQQAIQAQLPIDRFLQQFFPKQGLRIKN
jgi:hypothetical protein